MKKLVVANWKMNPDSWPEGQKLAAAAARLARRHERVKIVLCPPAPLLFPLHKFQPFFALGAQNAFFELAGPYTGETSLALLRKLGVEYVILGHSERRALGESDEIINKKIRAALQEGRKVIFCVGERERDSHGAYLAELRRQVENGLQKIPAAGWKNLLIAYEPVWAIGVRARAADTPENFLEQSLFIRRLISGLGGRSAADALKILYGGSVGAKNAGPFVERGQAAGLLVGRASLIVEEFKKIILAVDAAGSN